MKESIALPTLPAMSDTFWVTLAPVLATSPMVERADAVPDIPIIPAILEAISAPEATDEAISEPIYVPA